MPVGSNHPTALGGHGWHTDRVLSLVDVGDGVALGVVAEVEEPAEDTGEIVGVGDPARRVLAEEAGYVPSGGGPPVHVAGGTSSGTRSSAPDSTTTSVSSASP